MSGFKVHPARTLPFQELLAGLQEAKGAGIVSEQRGDDGLSLYCYTRRATYERLWTPISVLARGLVLDCVSQRVVATPFPKFFNHGENVSQSIPALPFEVFEKVDGSLIVIFHHNGKWKTATKGSFSSDQAKWAHEYLLRCDVSSLTPGVTYLAEAIYAENRIVVRYEEAGLILLAAYSENGDEYSFDELTTVGRALGWRTAKRHSFSSVSDLLAKASELPASEEGFVLRFSDGTRLKIKGAEYRRIHALVSRCSPLAMWEAMLAADDLANIRRDLPEEFWPDFDGIIRALNSQLRHIVEATAWEAQQRSEMSDKEIGLCLQTLPQEVRPFIFPYRKNDGDLFSGRTRQTLFRAIRPTGNILPGYEPSYALNRVIDEATSP